MQLLSYPAFSTGNATADFATGSVTFVPDAAFSGTTSFTYQITTNLGCSAIGTINLTEVVSPAANISGTTTFCQGTISNLDAGAGFASYNWTTPVGTANTQTVWLRQVETYQVIVTNANNCADTTSTLCNHQFASHTEHNRHSHSDLCRCIYDLGRRCRLCSI